MPVPLVASRSFFPDKCTTVSVIVGRNMLVGVGENNISAVFDTSIQKAIDMWQLKNTLLLIIKYIHGSVLRLFQTSKTGEQTA